MAFAQDQIDSLNASLSSENIKTRQQANQTLSYIEGWHVIAEANRIFGHDGWDRETELTALGEPEQVDGKWRARFMAKVTVRVRAEEIVITRQGTGYGSGIAKDQGDAFEGAIKEAETDATKRALMTFGWPFGLALYDKSRENVSDGQKDRYLAECRQRIAQATYAEALKEWWASDEQKQARKDFSLTQADVDALKQEISDKLTELEQAKEQAA